MNITSLLTIYSFMKLNSVFNLVQDFSKLGGYNQRHPNHEGSV